ncbi:MAG TPA: class I SAM-dependent methyltransferase [Flavisolibacter sp.]|nr:class I SAM-dependent methyltransferase [Flavisolibacter sp.]
MGTNINSSFFEGSYQHAWRSLIPPGLTEAEADFITGEAQLDQSSMVMDLMCGYGRHALELGKRGINVTAVDNLPAYTLEIEEQASRDSLPVTVIQANVLSLKLDRVYDAFICMGNSFAFFDRQETSGILHKISTHLKEGGVFIINSWMIAEIAIRHFREKEWYYAGEYKCLLDYKFCFNPSRIESEQTIIGPDGKIEILNGVDYIFTLAELEAIFQEAGMRTKAIYSTPRRRPFSLGDSRAYLVVEKL